MFVFVLFGYMSVFSDLLIQLDFFPTKKIINLSIYINTIIHDNVDLSFFLYSC